MYFIFVDFMKSMSGRRCSFTGRTSRRKRNFSIIDTRKNTNNILYVTPPADDNPVDDNPIVILRKHASFAYLRQKYFNNAKLTDITHVIVPKCESRLHNWKTLISKFRFLIALFSKRIIYITLYAKNGTTFVCLSKQTNVIYHRLYYEQVYRLHLFKIPS